MDDFRAIYRLLCILKESVDCQVFDKETINAKAIGVSEPRWKAYLEMLSDEGLIKGVAISDDMVGTWNARITLKGLEYLQDNSMMQRVRREEAETHNSVNYTLPEDAKELFIFSDRETLEWNVRNDGMTAIWGDTDYSEQHLPAYVAYR